MKNRYRYFLYPFLFLLIILALFFRVNAYNLYGFIADYYYKQNNINGAKAFYERAINLNNDAYSIKEKYINMLINQPMTIDIQERLVKIAESSVEDSSKYKATSFLNKLKEQVHKNYPYNYMQQAPYNQKIVHWGKSPITYSYVNKNVPDEILSGINDAFQEWENAGDNSIKFKEVASDGNIQIEFINTNIKDLEIGEKYTVAYTTPEISSDSLLCMNIKFNLKDVEGNVYSKNQIYNTALHEIFHALGFMGHSYDRNNIMHMSKDSYSVLKDSKHVLTEADISTMKLLYKTKPDITNSDEFTYEYVPYVVVGSNEDRNYSKSKEAKNYINNAPTLPNGYLDYAETLVVQKKYSQAINYLKKALNLSKSEDAKSIIYYDLAVCYFYSELYDEAAAALNIAQKIKKDDEMRHLSAEIAIKQNDFQKAVSEYSYLTSKYPENIDYTVALTNIYIKNNDYLKARNVIKAFIKNNPNDSNNPKLSAYSMLKL